MAVELPPLRSLQDFVSDAQFTAPTFHDRERMENRMINNLIYYQTNYFICAILIVIVVGTLYPKDLIIGAVTLFVAFVLFGIAESREPRFAQLKRQYPSLLPVAVVVLAMLVIYTLGSILVFIWGVTVPIVVILLHAAMRKRNIKNKFANTVELFKEDVTPMTILLSKICSAEEQQR
ncbi:PRA1 family protein 3-like isoform X1 [Stylophora pistillata]|uniref:PRA1 family protein n=1 Tax=Stylophora pistillata TaxID=50429 RepID=A0A2B4SS06_STYPI|nr:PRA1 family protein 3-like isoform X1 [Stylophora pistillata]PFX33444.1 PRA1 family protein 3 [Stylophora pistillata]